MKMNHNALKSFLDEQVERINTRAFVAADPVQFPRRYQLVQDIEITAFTVAVITWGKRPMILRDAERMLARMGDSPYEYVMNEGYRSLGRANVHRTFFEDDLACILRGFKHIYDRHATMEAYLQRCGVSRQTDGAAWRIAAALREALAEANHGEVRPQCLPTNFERSALKRINLALRWLVRNDGIVDVGAWTLLSPAQLYIPLDVHVAATARRLNLLSRKSNDRKAVEALTAALREFCPQDPVKYDFALFGIGVEKG
jgi:uncharacterized protein (TIGR02757 family)